MNTDDVQFTSKQIQDHIKESRDHFSEKVVQGACGATQSPVDERFDLVCPTALIRLARRYGLGAAKHSDFNYCLASEDPAFQRARINHALKHLVLYLLEGNEKDDNLAAAAWGCMTAMHYEDNCQHHLAPIPNNATVTEPSLNKKDLQGLKFNCTQGSHAIGEELPTVFGADIVKQLDRLDYTASEFEEYLKRAGLSVHDGLARLRMEFLKEQEIELATSMKKLVDKGTHLPGGGVGQ